MKNKVEKILNGLATKYGVGFYPVKTVNGVAVHFKSVMFNNENSQYVGFCGFRHGEVELLNLTRIDYSHGQLIETIIFERN